MKGDVEMDNLFLILGWGSPIGLGIFLFLLGSMIYMITKADAIGKRAKHEYKDKK